MTRPGFLIGLRKKGRRERVQFDTETDWSPTRTGTRNSQAVWGIIIPGGFGKRFVSQGRTTDSGEQSLCRQVEKQRGFMPFKRQGMWLTRREWRLFFHL